ncbi:hypothetical protein, partial [Eggerthella lenta]|uniref:hypothetical protein n=1 Tax=Eggerthella lenta TaxID=84112 RepID=UPI001C696EA7
MLAAEKPDLVLLWISRLLVGGETLILRLNRDSLPECETAAENPVASRKLVYQSVSGGRAKPAREKRTSSRIVNHHKRQIRRKAMP